MPDRRPNRPACSAGDRVLSINGRSINTWEDLSESIEKLGQNPLNLHVKRADSEIAVTVTPTINEVKNLFGETIKRPLIGITASEATTVRSVNPLAAGYYALAHTYNLSKLFFLTVVKLIQRIVPLKTLGGPILIAQMAGKQAQKGILELHELHGPHKRKPGCLESFAHPDTRRWPYFLLPDRSGPRQATLIEKNRNRPEGGISRSSVPDGRRFL